MRRHTRLSCDWSSDVCSSDRSEEHMSELQSHDNLVCRIIRSEEHTSELQSHDNLVCRLLLEKKKTRTKSHCHVRPLNATTVTTCPPTHANAKWVQAKLKLCLSFHQNNENNWSVFFLGKEPLRRFHFFPDGLLSG